MPFSSNEVINEQLTQLFEITDFVRRDLSEPHSHWSFEGGRKGPTHNLVWNPLKVHRSLKSCNVIKGVTHSIIRIQRRHLELQWQGVTIDGSRERGICIVN